MQQPFLDHLVGREWPGSAGHPAAARPSKFTRSDGCETGRGDRLAFLFPVKPGSP
jgi:hypothetical protein